MAGLGAGVLPLVSAIGWAGGQLGARRATRVAGRPWESCSVPGWRPSGAGGGDGAERGVHERRLPRVNLPWARGGAAMALGPPAVAALRNTAGFTKRRGSAPNRGRAEPEFGNSESSRLRACRLRGKKSTEDLLLTCCSPLGC
ncbi:uncharacterized protein PHA67_015662 isoform 1-T2 [Liasis olivaceus]